MKKTSYYLAAIVFVSVGVVAFWVYQNFLKPTPANLLVFPVVRGDMREQVSARGEVVPEKEFDLEFPFGGTIEQVYVKEGQQVKTGDSLMKLDTKELLLERARLQSVVTQSEASLQNLLNGVKEEDLSVSEARVTSAEQALADAKKTLLDANLTAYTQADDAIHNTADKFFDNPRTTNPTLNLAISDSQLKTNLNADRATLETSLISWKASLPVDTSDISTRTATAKANLLSVKTFLQNLAAAVNSMSSSATLTQTTLDGWKTSVSTARTTIDTAITTVTTAEEKVRTADSSLALAQSELALKKSAPRVTDVTIAKASVDQSKSELALTDEKIYKSTLRAPGSGVVQKLLLEKGEVFTPGVTVIMFASSGYKIQSDISELDIDKVHYTDGSEASIRFDAFPDKELKGRVVFIEPKEVIKDGDVYFRTDIFLEDHNVDIRSRMSADVVLYGAAKKNILTIPELAVEKRGGKSYVKVARGAQTKEAAQTSVLVDTEITTGISNGESVEVVTGLTEGEFVVVSSD